VIRVLQFVDLRTGVMYSHRQFDAKYSHRLPPKVQPSKLTLAYKGLRKVETVTYRPGSDRLLDEDGLSALNLYRPSTVTPVPGDVGPWLDLVHRVVPNEPAREHVLNFLAHLVQHPGVKINHALFLGSKVQGIGKDFHRAAGRSDLGAPQLRHHHATGS
jgi:hypothetical protein